MNRIRSVAIAIAIAAVALAAAGCSTRVVTTPSAGAGANTVTASGTGKVAAPPDVAVMSFGVTRRDADAKRALSQASSAAEKINAALAKQGIAKEDLQTSGVTVYPQYEMESGKNAISGFEASINVTAKVRDLEKLGAVISALSDAGADNINGPSFAIDEDAAYRADAIKEAVDDARAQAQEMAEAAGKRVGEVVSITSSAVNVPGPLYADARAYATAEKLAVPIETGQLDVTADVTVVFELK